MDGNIILWEIYNDEIGENIVLEKFFEYSLTQFYQNIPNKNNYGCQVQSLSIGNRSILIGTKDGSIYEAPIPKNALSLTTKSASLINKKLNAVDFEIPKIQCISTCSTHLYTISQNGFFQVWNLVHLNQIYQHAFDQNAFFMIFCKKE